MSPGALAWAGLGHRQHSVACKALGSALASGNRRLLHAAFCPVPGHERESLPQRPSLGEGARDLPSRMFPLAARAAEAGPACLWPVPTGPPAVRIPPSLPVTPAFLATPAPPRCVSQGSWCINGRLWLSSKALRDISRHLPIPQNVANAKLPSLGLGFFICIMEPNSCSRPHPHPPPRPEEV